jgi:PAS domain S-box-containing protein
MTLRTKLAMAFGIALAAICSVGVLSYRSTLQVDEDQRRVVHTHRVLQKLDDVVTDLLSARANQRAYVVGKDDSYLSGYKSDLGRLQDDLKDVGELTSDNPRQQQALQQLRPLISSRVAELEEGIAVSIQQKTTSSTFLAEILERPSLLDITSRLSEMKHEESRLLIQRSQAAKAASSRMKGVIVFGDLLALLLLVTAVLELQRETARRAGIERELHESEQRFRLMVSNVKEYAIFMLGPKGHVVSWNAGAQRIKSYQPEEIIGRHFSCFYPAEDIERGRPEYELKLAAEQGQSVDEGWRVRKDGSRFWANTVITALRDPAGRLRGFSKITRDLTERRRTEEEIKRQNALLAAANKELDAFSYSVAHDLRAPLRAVDGFSLALLQDFPDDVPEEGRRYLERIRSGAQRMAQLIEDLLKLSRISRHQIVRSEVDLSRVAAEVAAQLKASDPNRQVKFAIAADLVVFGDRNLLRIVLENLMANAWKFTSRQPQAEIHLGLKNGEEERVLFIRDNGCGFDMKYADKLFGVFQRLHRESEFSGTGIGLATVHRIISRHGGRIWAEAAVGEGATFYFVVLGRIQGA